MLIEENVTSNENESETQGTQQEIENTTANNQTQEPEKFDYRKARDERVAKNTEKRILRDLGADTIDEVKAKLQESIETQKKLFNECENGKKLCVFREGVEKMFVDYVTYAVSKDLKDGESFEKKLKVFLKENPQFAGDRPRVSFNSSPNLEDNKTIKLKGNYWMNNFLRGKNKIY